MPGTDAPPDGLLLGKVPGDGLPPDGPLGTVPGKLFGRDGPDGLPDGPEGPLGVPPLGGISQFLPMYPVEGEKFQLIII